MRSTLAKSRYFFAIALLVASFGMSLLPASNVAAAGELDNIDGKVTQWLYYRGIWACMGGNIPHELSRDEVLDGKWFPEGKRGFGYIGPSLDNANDNDGTVNCDDGSAIDRATEDYFGFDDEVAMLCAMDDVFNAAGKPNVIRPSVGEEDCLESNNFDLNLGGNWRAAFTDALSASLESKGGRPRFNLGDNPDSKAWYYWIGKRGLEVFCGNNTPISQGVDSAAGSSNDIVDVDSVDPRTGEIKKGVNYYLANDDRDQGSKIDDVYYASGSTDEAADRTCLELADLTKENSAAYSAYVIAHPDESLPDPGGPTNPDNLEPVCSAGGLGWVICPAIDLMQQATTKVAELLGSVLRINPLRTSGSDSIYTVWSSILNVANIMLVIAFLMVVFSQATSYGLSNYGIKRMLPRIIAAAILMNISFFICQVLVDISNILGAGAAEFVSTAACDPTLASSSGSCFADNIREQSSTIMQVVVGGAIIAIIAFFFLIPTLLAVLAVFFTIAARNAIIILLVMVAPLAFAAWILPNTEKYFQKWWGLLVNMLMLYPMVMFIFAASVVAANAISTAGNNSEVQSIIALLVMAMPLFALPFLFKAAGGVLGKINDMTKARAGQGINKAKSGYDNSGFAKYRAQKKEQLRGQELAGTYGGKNKLRTLRGRASRSVYGSRLTGGYGSSILDQASQKREEMTERAATYASRNPALAKAMLAYAGNGGNVEAAAKANGLDAAATQTLQQLHRQGVISPGVSAARVAVSGLAQGGKLKKTDINEAQRIIKDASLSGAEQERQLGQMAGDIIGGSGKSGMVQHGNYGVVGSGKDATLDQGALGTERVDPVTGAKRRATAAEAISDDLRKKSFPDLHYNALRKGTGGREALDSLIGTDASYRASAVAAMSDGRVSPRVKAELAASLLHYGYDATGASTTAVPRSAQAPPSADEAADYWDY